MKILSKITNFNFILFFLLISVLSFMYIPIFKESVLFKQLDFQWSPSKLVFEGINHYQYMLEGNRDGIIGSQYGEYLHGLYILIYPFTLLSWQNAKIAWFLFNLILIITIPLLLCKKFNIKTSETLLIIFFFMSASVTKAHMVIGQQSLLILFFFCLPFISNSRLSLLFSGISYLKYSIGYVLFLNFLVSKKIKYIFFSSIIPILGWMFYSYTTNSNLLQTAFQPFSLAIQNHLTNENGVSIMPKNIFFLSFLEFFEFEFRSIFAIVISLLLNTYFIFKIKNLNDNLLKLSCLLISTLIFFPHYPHNFVLVLPLLIHSIKNFEKTKSKISFFAAIYFLFFFRAVEIYLPYIIKNFLIQSEFLISYFNTLFLFFILIINIYEIRFFNYNIKHKK